MAIVGVPFDSGTSYRSGTRFGPRKIRDGTPFRRAIEEGLIDTDAYIQVGIRGSTSGANDLEDARQLGAEVLTIKQAFEMGIPANFI